MDMGKCISKLALNQEFSDISIVVGPDGQVFPAHKLILAARSEYFRRMFYESKMKEARDGTCTFLYDEPQVFKTMLYHLYSRPIDGPTEPKHLVMCLVTAEKYGIDSFSTYCLDALKEAFSPSTACDILTLLEGIFDDERTSIKDTVHQCFKYIIKNLEDIVMGNGHHSLSKKTFERVLQTPTLCTPEIELFRAVASWHRNRYGDYYTQRDSLLDQLALLDLRLIELCSLAEFVHMSGVFSQDEMAELYRRRITLNEFDHSSRNEGNFGLIFHGGADYETRPKDVITNLAKLDILFSTDDVYNFSNTCNITCLSLMQYSSVVVFSMETRSQGMCGDALADYVDRGGCVVLCNAMGCIGGRITTSQYMPVERLEPYSGEFRALQLGKVLIPSHPLFDSVKDIKVRCGFNFVWNCKAAKDTKVIAEWSDGTILACERACGKGRVVFLNLYPVSTQVVIVGLEKTDILLSNALMYAAYNPCKWL